MSQSQSAETGESKANPTRRKFIKGITIGTGAAAIGGVSTQTRFSPVGRSEAVLPAVAIVGGGFIAGGIARYAYEQYVHDSSGDVDESDPLATQVHSIALSNETAFQPRRDNISKDNRKKRFEDSLWSEVRAAGARAFEDDQNATTALGNAKTRMQQVYNNRVVNIIRSWNAEVGSSQNALQLLIENQADIESSLMSAGYRYYEDQPFDYNFASSSTGLKNPSEFSTSVSDGYASLVVNMDTLLKGGEDIDIWLTIHDDGENIDATVEGNPVHRSIFGLTEITLEDGTAGAGLTNSVSGQYVADPNDNTSEARGLLIHGTPYRQALRQTQEVYSKVLSDAETYLNNLESKYEKGTVDSSSVLTGRELMEEQGYVDEDGELTEEYEGATDEERLAAESIASGMGAPDDAGVRARVNHASLSSERTGNLFIDFTGNGGSLTVGEIAAADYNYAIMGVTYDDGSFGIETLESEADDGTAQPIEVLEVIGAEEREFSYTDEEITVGTGGDVVVYEGTDPPKELANPSEYQGFEIDIDTPNSSASVPIADVTESGSKYIAPTSLSEGTTVESITFRAPVNYEEYSSYSQGDTTVDLERLQEQEEVISRQQEQLEELQNQGGGGGGGFLPDVSVDSNSTIIAAVAVVLVAFGLLGNN